MDKGRGWDDGVEGGRQQWGCHESRRHSILPISTVPLQQAHITESHRTVNDIHIYIEVFGTMSWGGKMGRSAD